jgi:hypothetical protein
MINAIDLANVLATIFVWGLGLAMGFVFLIVTLAMLSRILSVLLAPLAWLENLMVKLTEPRKAQP